MCVYLLARFLNQFCSPCFINSFRSTIFVFILWISARFWAISRWTQWCIACFQPELPTIPYLSLASVEWKFPKFYLMVSEPHQQLALKATATKCICRAGAELSWEYLLASLKLVSFRRIEKFYPLWKFKRKIIQTQNNSNAHQLNELQSFMWTTFTQAHRRKFVSLAIFAVNIQIFIQIDGSFWSPTKLWTN